MNVAIVGAGYAGVVTGAVSDLGEDVVRVDRGAARVRHVAARAKSNLERRRSLMRRPRIVPRTVARGTAPAGGDAPRQPKRVFPT